MLRRCPSPESTPVSTLVQRLNVHEVSVGDDGLVITHDRGIDDSDGAVARRFDVDAVENVGAACRPVDDGQQSTTSPNIDRFSNFFYRHSPRVICGGFIKWALAFVLHFLLFILFSVYVLTTLSF